MTIDDVRGAPETSLHHPESRPNAGGDSLTSILIQGLNIHYGLIIDTWGARPFPWEIKATKMNLLNLIQL